MSGALVAVAGGWILTQLFVGQALQRLGILGEAAPGVVTVTPGNLSTPGEDARDRRAAAGGK